MSNPLPILRTLLAAVATVAWLAPATAQAGGVDPNTFRVGHPASPTWKLPAHAHGEHPAVLLHRAGLAPVGIDANQFRVQPPASVRWLSSAEGDATVADAAGSGLLAGRLLGAR